MFRCIQLYVPACHRYGDVQYEARMLVELYMYHQCDVFIRWLTCRGYAAVIVVVCAFMWHSMSTGPLQVTSGIGLCHCSSMKMMHDWPHVLLSCGFRFGLHVLLTVRWQWLISRY
ncbi:hypothetical protein J3F84DRAFT_233229 [Trichoderma pleuroticola]